VLPTLRPVLDVGHPAPIGAAEPWQPLARGPPEPLPAMPYALGATDRPVVAGLADGQPWERRDGGDSSAEMRFEGDPPGALVALVHAGT
jgi:hypothetical protein